MSMLPVLKAGTRPSQQAAPAPLDVAVIVPTFNEHVNVPILAARLERVLQGRSWEMIVVDDDSPDGTSAVVRMLGKSDPRIRCIQRIGRRGLSTACIEGLLATHAPVLVVMDADLQHDEALLPAMIDSLQDPEIDLVVGSRYVEGGGTGDWTPFRRRLSRLATKAAAIGTGTTLTDPMSGFLAIRREAFNETVRHLSGRGFKLLLDICASSPRPLRVRELPFVFRSRAYGESKLDAGVIWQFGMMLADKALGRFLPARFVMFCLVGASGLAVQMGVLWALFRGFDFAFTPALALSTLAAMISNFWLNNCVTWRDRRLTGRRFWTGMATFIATCSVGAAANVGVGNLVYGSQSSWWVAGICGALVAAVFNYAASACLTWRKGRGELI
jgi:dolichol-phosphate mannosyltransferase